MKDHQEFTEENISNYLSRYLNHSPATYNAELKVIRRLGKYRKLQEISNAFKFASVDILPNQAPTTKQVAQGYKALTKPLAKAIYLFVATTGLRKGEVLNLRKEDINWENRAVVPNHFTKTKRSGITFFNKETEKWLLRYLETRDDQNPTLFQISERQLKTIWDTASKGSGTRITT